MKKTFAAISAACLLAVPAVPVFAQDVPDAVKARQGQFRIMAINLGILGSMAKGEREYDAEAAQNAADSLVAVSGVHQPPLWPQGTDTMSIDGTRAEPAIWDNLDDVLAKWSDYGDAAAQMQSVAADGQSALGPALGQMGNACKACHDEYRAPE
jgi:cytochrome c556